MGSPQDQDKDKAVPLVDLGLIQISLAMTAAGFLILDSSSATLGLPPDTVLRTFDLRLVAGSVILVLGASASVFLLMVYTNRWRRTHTPDFGFGLVPRLSARVALSFVMLAHQLLILASVLLAMVLLIIGLSTL